MWIKTFLHAPIMSIKVKRKLHDMRMMGKGLRECEARSNPKNKICEQLEHKPVILKSIKRGIYHERKVTGN